MTKPVAIVLGGTNPHIEVIRQLKSRGYYVVLVDYLEDSPARKFADKHVRESTLILDDVLRVAKEYNASLVIAPCVDQANMVACYVAEQLNLPHPYSYELAKNITNKGFMKRVMRENGIPTTRFIFLDRDEELDDAFDLDYPVMVKPADSNAANGVKKASNRKELDVFLAEAKRYSRTGRTVVEEFVSGTELSVYAYVQNGVANVLLMVERVSCIEGEDQVLKCYATITPPNISRAAEKKISEVVNRLCVAFGLDNTSLHVQFIVSGDDVDVIEFAPRVGGGISYETIKKATGFDIISATIDSYLNKKVDVLFSRNDICYSVNLVYGIPSVFDKMVGGEKLIVDGVVDAVHFHKCSGAKLSGERASAGRIAALLISGKSREEVLAKIAKAFSELKAYDKDGNQILRNDLYLKF